MSKSQTTAMFKVKIEQPVATVENTTGAAMQRRTDEWNRLVAEQAADGYAFSVGYQGIVTFSAGRDAHRRPDRHFTSNLALQLVPRDQWGYALTTV